MDYSGFESISVTFLCQFLACYVLQLPGKQDKRCVPVDSVRMILIIISVLYTIFGFLNWSVDLF